MNTPHIMLFDLYSGGHHFQYIQQLATYWANTIRSGILSIVVPQQMVTAHPSLKTFVDDHADTGLRLFPIDEVTDVREGEAGMRTLIKNDREHGRLLQRYVNALRPDHTILMYFDHVQLSLATGVRFDFNTTLSGIYFRPSFHYRMDGAVSWKEKAQRFRKRQTLAAALRNPHFTRLLCLDPYVVPVVQSMQTDTEAIFLPDGADPDLPKKTLEETRSQFGVEPHRTVALFFGVVDRRKGIHKVLEAIQLLPDDVQEKLCLIVAGRITDPQKADLLADMQGLQQHKRLQLILQEGFVPDDTLADLTHAADVLLVTYQRHIGSSNVLVRAAGAERPVLGSDYGLVGEHLRRKKLGLAVDTTNAYAVADGLTTFINDRSAVPFDVDEARAFATANTATKHAAVVFQGIHPAVPSS